MICVLTGRGENTQRHEYTQKLWSYDNGDRNCSDVSISQTMPRIATKWQNYNRQEKLLSPEFQRECGSADIVILDF